MAEQHKDFSCPACGAEFDSREQLEKHGESAHKQTGQSGGGSSPRQTDPSEGSRESNR